MPERVGIVGSRDFRKLYWVWQYVHNLPSDTIVVSGGARGPDRIAANAAHDAGLTVEEYQPDWEAHGKAAGPLRNAEIVAACDRLVAFWDGKSPGTKNTIALAEAAGKDVEVIYWPPVKPP